MTEAEFEKCINRICRGDKTGLKEIYEEYMPYIYRTVLSVVGSREDAEDVTSDFFVKLWSLAPKYRPGSGHKGYLATIARNMAVDLVRKRRREVPLEVPDAEQEDDSGRIRAGTTAEAQQATPDEATPEEQVVEQVSIQEALERLKPEERQIIDMKVLGEMTFKEISELLGIPMGTVTWRYQEGIKRLRRCGYE